MPYRKAVLKNFALSTRNTCVGVYFLKSWRPLDQQLYQKEIPRQVFFFQRVNIAKFSILSVNNNTSVNGCFLNFSMVHSYMDLNGYG